MILDIMLIVIIVCVSLLIIYGVYLLGEIKGICEAEEIYGDCLDEILKIHNDYYNRVLKLFDEERGI